MYIESALIIRTSLKHLSYRTVVKQLTINTNNNLKCQKFLAKNALQVKLITQSSFTPESHIAASLANTDQQETCPRAHDHVLGEEETEPTTFHLPNNFFPFYLFFQRCPVVVFQACYIEQMVAYMLQGGFALQHCCYSNLCLHNF
ncbi:hypothetical protein AMECASPLE_026243 [Ameca splendens]|uniref:Uncharacterized protein n=1 Tax=Ameca splendens TaxID=208324 RepID=A0ABV0YG59_9TELE